MAERHNTGGAKSFHYSKEDLERIRTTDTSSTKEFKKALSEWRAHREQERLLEEEFRKKRNMMVIVLIMLLLTLALLFWLRLFGSR